MPPAVSWVPYLMPTKYLLTGSVWSVVNSNDYLDPASGITVSGKTVLQQVFDLTDEKPWILLLVGLAFAVGFRLQHLSVMHVHLRKLGRGTTAAVNSPPPKSGLATESPQAVQNDAIPMIHMTEVSGQLSKSGTANPRRSMLTAI
jgi:hypothetical protein